MFSQVVPEANQLINLNTTRGWALRGKTPAIVLFVLLVRSLIASGLIGQSFSKNQRRHLWISLTFNLLLTVILYVILDIDGPRYGLIQVDRTLFKELSESLKGR